MTPVFRPSTPADADRIQEFLSRTFQNGKSSPLWRSDVLDWKYWEPRPDWPGSRSYIVERDNVILAHGAAWPMPLSSNSGSISGFFFYDWAADPASPGMGAAVLQEMRAVAGVAWLCGGTEQGQKLFTTTGFRPIQTVSVYALPLRPFRAEWVRRDPGWKSARRLARNQLRKWRAARPGQSWEAVPLEHPEKLPPRRNRSHGFPSSLQFAPYYARCPHAEVSWHEVRKGGQTRGFFCLVTVPGAARIAEAVMDLRDPDSWKNLAALAIEAAASRNCDEIMAWASLTEMCAGLAAAGFERCGQQEFMACGLPAGLLEDELDIQLVHGDMAFFYSGSPWYLC
jgi:hypothetical protein